MGKRGTRRAVDGERNPFQVLFEAVVELEYGGDEKGFIQRLAKLGTPASTVETWRRVGAPLPKLESLEPLAVLTRLPASDFWRLARFPGQPHEVPRATVSVRIDPSLKGKGEVITSARHPLLPPGYKVPNAPLGGAVDPGLLIREWRAYFANREAELRRTYKTVASCGQSPTEPRHTRP